MLYHSGILTLKNIKLFNMPIFGGNNTLSWRSETLAELPYEAFPHRRHAQFTEALSLICVAVASLARLFLNVRLQAEVEGLQIW